MKKLLFSVAFIATSFFTTAQVGIGTTSIDASALLELDATDKALLLPRVTSTSAVTTAVNGMLVYDVSADCVKSYQNGAWTQCLGTATTLTPSATVLAQIGLEADVAATVPSVVTVAQINMISPAITGALPANEAAYQAYIDANPGSFSSPATQPEVQAMITAVNAAEALPKVTGAAGQIWMDRNLGASQAATSSTDAASYGDLYQWGRNSDGHELRGSTTTPTLAPTSTPSHGNFITGANTPYNWLATPNDNLWNSGTEAAPVKGANDPCPYGYRVPTESELDAERLLFSTQNTGGAFASPLKLPVAGRRGGSTGTLNVVGSNGSYWSSTVSGSNARNLTFGSSAATMNTNVRTVGLSVRCLKE